MIAIIFMFVAWACFVFYYLYGYTEMEHAIKGLRSIFRVGYPAVLMSLPIIVNNPDDMYFMLAFVLCELVVSALAHYFYYDLTGKKL